MSQNRKLFPDGYKVDATTDVSTFPYYILFVNEAGEWVIERKQTSESTISDYCAGNSDYSTAWTNCAGLTYVAREALFS